MTSRFILVLAALVGAGGNAAVAQTAAPAGEIKGDAWVHTRDSLAASVQQADVCLPAAVTGGAVFCGKFKDLPKVGAKPVPVVLFLHGSSGLGLKAIGEEFRVPSRGRAVEKCASPCVVIEKRLHFGRNRLVAPGFTHQPRIQVGAIVVERSLEQLADAWPARVHHAVPLNSRKSQARASAQRRLSVL